ncbi:MAG: LCP family protein [Firmicutes bacterium]|nr:LCP family protein [Bacillota bacterium]
MDDTHRPPGGVPLRIPTRRAPKRRRYRLRNPRRLATVLTGVLLAAALAIWLAWPGRGAAGPEAPASARPSGESLAERAAEPIWILLLGVDRRPEDSGRSDALILAQLTADRSRLRLLSLPRDTRVTIPGHGTGKLNAAYALGGPDLALATVSDLVGVPVRHYVAVDMEGLRWAVDQLGGVEIDVDRRMYYEDPYQGLRIDLQPGKQRLSGDQALQFLRFRLSGDGQHDDDLTRVQRQQRFLQALLAQAITPEHWPELVTILRSAGQYLETNLTFQEQLELGRQLLAARQHVETATLPGTTSQVGGAWYYLVDKPALEQLLATWGVSQTR